MKDDFKVARNGVKAVGSGNSPRTVKSAGGWEYR